MSRRRIVTTPLQQIIHYFLTASLPEITQATEVAQAIVNQRMAGGQVMPLAPRRPKLVPPVPSAQPVAPANIIYDEPRPPAPPAKPPAPPRQRAKRSDAGQARKRRSTAGGAASAANGPVRRRRAAEVDVPLPGLAASPEPPPLPDQIVADEE